MRSRPVLRYHGGKWKLAPWVMTFFPSHRMYVEPFGGGASVLMRKARAYGEVYNDLDTEVVNVFKVLRSPALSSELEKQLRLTPFARDEFEDAYHVTSDPVEAARRTIVKSFMGFGSASIHNTTGFRTHASTRPPTGFRSNSNRSGTTPAHDWANYPCQIERFCERLAGVVIENIDALALIKQHDNDEALFYVDPPYPMGTRSDNGKDYTHEMSDDDHRALAAVLQDVRGMVVLSGYACALYDQELYVDWGRAERAHLADGAAKRTEVIWINPACAAALLNAGNQFSLGSHL